MQTAWNANRLLIVLFASIPIAALTPAPVSAQAFPSKPLRPICLSSRATTNEPVENCEMTVLKMVSTEPEDPELEAMFAEVRARGVALPNLYRVLGLAPKMLRAWLDFAWPLRLHAKTARSLRELLILRGAQISGATYEWAHHVGMALAAGVTQAKIDALPLAQDSALFSPQEKAIIRLAEEVTRGPGASPACIELLKQRGFSDAEIVELVLTASFYVCVGRFLHSMDVDLEAGAKHTSASRA